MTMDNFLQQVLESEFGERAAALQEQVLKEQTEARAARVAELMAEYRAAQEDYSTATQELRDAQQRARDIEAELDAAESAVVSARSARHQAARMVKRISEALGELEH